VVDAAVGDGLLAARLGIFGLADAAGRQGWSREEQLADRCWQLGTLTQRSREDEEGGHLTVLLAFQLFVNR
jgi:hypothetical protein